MKIKRLIYIMGLAVILTIAMSMVCFADDENSGKCGDDLTWRVEEEILYISGSGEMWDQDSWEGNVLAYASDITKVVIDDGVTGIGTYGFYGLTALKDIEIPETVTSIGRGAFVRCDALEEIVLPTGITTISEEMFYSCKSLTAVRCKGALTRIEGYAFYKCNNLELFAIPDTVNYIGLEAFENCSKLSNVNIPEGITRIYAYTFAGCTSLTEVSIPSSVGRINSNAFASCYKLRKAELNDGLEEIGAFAFSNCKELQSIEVPDSVTSIERGAFMGCSELSYAIIPDDVTVLGQSRSTNPTVFSYFGGTTNVGGLFENCSKLRSVSFSNNVTSIEYGTFYGCSSLSDIYYYGNEEQWNQINIVPNGNSAIDNATIHFMGTKRVSVEGILRQGDGWTTRWIATYVPEGNKNASLEIYVDGENKEEGELLLYSDLDNIFDMPWLTEEYGLEKTDFTKLIIKGTGVNPVNIVSDQFSGYTKLRTVQLECAATIQGHAFTDCTKLRTVLFDQYLTYIGAGAFRGCSSLTSMMTDLGDTNVSEVGDEAFMNTALSKFKTYNLKKIGERAFAYTQIKEASLGSAKEMGKEAFAHSALEDVEIGEDLTVLDDGVFGYTGLVGIRLGKKIGKISKTAFEGIDVKIICYKDSYAHDYAKRMDMRYELIDWLTLRFDPAIYKKEKTLIDISFGWCYDLFEKPASEPSDELAIASLILSANVGDWDLIQENFEAMGFHHPVRGNYAYDETNRVGYAIASTTRTIDGQKTNVIAVVCRGSSNMQDWLSNLFAQALGFREAADNVKEGIDNYIADGDNGIDTSLPTKLLITGHSRGAAVANLLGSSVRSIAPLKDTFVYTFACPNTSTDSDRRDFDNIHNVNVQGDPVPLVPPMFGSFNRFGSTTILAADPNDQTFINTFHDVTGGVSTVAIDSNSAECSTAYDLGGLPLARHHTPGVYMACLLTPIKENSKDTVLIDAAERNMPYKVKRISVKCPVDVKIYDSEDHLLGTIENNVPSDSLLGYGLYAEIEGDEKYIYTGLDCKLRVELTGTDEGTMEYSVDDINGETEEILDTIKFSDVRLEPGKEMQTSVNNENPEEDNNLFIVEDDIIVAKINEDGTEEPVAPVPGKYYKLYGVKYDHNLDYYAEYKNPEENTDPLPAIMCAVARSAYDETERSNVYGSLGFKDTRAYPDCLISRRTSEYGTELVLVNALGPDDLAPDGSFLDLSLEDSTGAVRRMSRFRAGADHIMNELKEYLGTEPGSSQNVHYFVTGYREGGAIANIFAADLTTAVGGDKVHGLTFACPGTVLSTDLSDNEAFESFRNLKNYYSNTDQFAMLPGNPSAAMPEMKEADVEDPLDIVEQFSPLNFSWKRLGWDMPFEDGITTADAHDLAHYYDALSVDGMINYEYRESNYIFSSTVRNVYILGPADVHIEDTKGKRIASVTGTDPSYSSGSFGKVVITVYGDMKCISLPEAENYKIRITGTAAGTMDYMVTTQYPDWVSPSQVTKIRNVTLEEGRNITGISGKGFGDLDDLNLYVTDAQGEPTYEIHDNGRESKIGAQYGICGEDLWWTLDEGVLSIKGTGEMFDYSMFDPAPWMKYSDSIIKVDIEEGVTGIGSEAFMHLRIPTIEFPASLKKIGTAAFYNCDSLKKVVIPSNVTGIGSCAFIDCSSLKDISVPAELKNIGGGAFHETPWFDAQGDFVVINSILMAYKGEEKTVRIPEGIIEINDYAFADAMVTPYSALILDNTELREVVIPDSVTRIGSSSFFGCVSIREFHLPSGLKEIGSEAFCRCTGIVRMDIPEGVRSICDEAFYGCTKLVALSIPASVDTIGNGVFAGCDMLGTVGISPGNESFVCMNGAIFSKDLTEMLMYLPGADADTFIMPESVTVLRSDAFENCKKIRHVELSDGIRTIGPYTFFGCEKLESIKMPAELTIIDDHAFGNCISLQNVILPSKIDEIRILAFAGCDDLTAIEIPGGTRMIWDPGFDYCDSLRDIYFTGTEEKWNKCLVDTKFNKNVRIHFNSHMPARTAIDKAAVSTVSALTYSGKAKTPAVTVTLNGKKLVSGTDYVLKYSNNINIGRAKIKVLGIGKYTGKVISGFNIKPKATSIIKVKAAKKAITVKWKKAGSVTGYQIQYGLKKNFKGAKKITIRKAGTVSKKITKLKTKKYYYIRIRTFKTVSGKTFYSAWSKAKKAKTK